MAAAPSASIRGATRRPTRRARISTSNAGIRSPVGSRPLGASAWGVEDLVGNGWEWTSTIFEPFPGFKPMAAYPEYSADFFDGQHYVMKGASPVTAQRAGASELPQLVPSHLSVCVRDVPLRARSPLRTTNHEPASPRREGPDCGIGRVRRLRTHAPPRPAPVRPIAPDAIDATLIADVCTGLTATPKTLPSKYLYDALGSALFEAICRLPWYEVTRAEQRLLECYAVAIGALADPRLIVELGPGSGDKLATLVRPLARAQPSLHLHLIDISPAALDQASRTVGAALARARHHQPRDV